MADKPKRDTSAFWYTPKGDRELPPERQSSFLLRPLTWLERLRAFDELTAVEIREVEGQAVQIQHNRGWQQAGELVLKHLVEVRNYPAGAPEPWPSDGSRKQKDAYLEGFDEMLILELGRELRERSVMSDAAGNSSAPVPT